MVMTANNNMRSTDRVLVLKVKEGKKPLSTLGAQDVRLFNGENKLHAIMDGATCLWRVKYDSGSLPLPLQCSFTSFAKLKAHIEDYYNKRNIDIIEIQD